MNKHRAKAGRYLPRTVEREAEVVRPWAAASSLVRIRYSYAAISARGGTAHLQARQARFEDGRLTAESFEGELDRAAYDRMIAAAEQHFLEQAALFAKSLSLFLPFSRTEDADRDRSPPA